MDHDALFEAVYTRPDDDAPRARLAAALRSAGDPRGELIELQLRESRTSAENERIRALLRAHAAAWIAPLRGALVARSVAWDRGFPVAGTLASRKPKERHRSIGVSALATLRRLELSKAETAPPVDWLRRVLFESPLRGLRDLRGVWRELLPDLLRSDPPWALERVECLYWGGAPRPGEREAIAAAFATCSGLPHLRELALTFQAIGNDPPLYGWIPETASGRALRSLSMTVSADHIARWHPALVEWGDAIDLERVTFGPVELRRTEDGWSRLRGAAGTEHVARDLRAALAATPAITEVDVDGL